MKFDAQDTRLALDALTVGYGGVPLISDIALSLRAGEIVTLIGPNGAGKSTILKSITRHLAALAGTVYLDGEDMRLLGGREIAQKMAAVFTDSIRPEMTTCFEFVAAGRYPYTGSFGALTPEDKKIVGAALDKVRASELAAREISSISDGQRQRILLARALCQTPRVIVLDEPTSFLDVRHKIELLEILSDMAKKDGIAVLMSLHEIDLAARISDRIVCVRGGEITAVGSPDQIFTDEMIRDLYGIERGSFGALLGNIELPAPCGAPRCFVVGGGGYGIPFYRALQKRGVPFAAGILLWGDVDLVVAKPLSQEVVCTPPFQAARAQDTAKAKALIDAASLVLNCGAPVGEYNRCNAELLQYAAGAGKTVVTDLDGLDAAIAREGTV
ncbi:MAG: ABC transporter ATP-binding protein [Clostridia bacterium]|nr:ABC transporter ATP-binding protein [Clostridia bacterium]